MSGCTTGCRTKDHASYADCLKAKSLRVAYCNSASGQDATAQKAWDKNLDAYREARKQGIQPSSTQRDAVDRAVAISDATGTAFQA